MAAKQNKDLSPSIRLARLSGLPLPKDVADISAESRRCKKRVELPWHPEGRPEPVVLSASYDESNGKTHWMLFDGIKETASVIWSAVGAEPAKVVQALRDWFTVARLAESWDAETREDVSRPAPTPPPPGFPHTQPMGADSPAPREAASGLPNPVGTEQLNTYPPGFLTPPMPFPALTYEQVVQPYPGGPGYVPPAAPQQWPPGYSQYPSDPEAAAKQWARAGESAPAPTPTHTVPDIQVPQPGAVSTLMLGDVLVDSGIIPTKTLQAALTLQNASPINRKPIGEILVSSGALPNNVLKAAVELQAKARQGSITRNRMTEILQKVASSGASLESLLNPKPTAPQATLESAVSKRIRPSDERIEKEAEVSEEERKKLKDVMSLLKQVDFKGDDGAANAQKLIDFLKQAQLVSEEAVQSAAKSVSNPADVIKAMLVKELIQPITFEAAMDCQKLIAKERLAVGQAIIAVGYCERSRINLKDAIAEMGWDIQLD
jgi:hypothetical protein